MLLTFEDFQEAKEAVDNILNTSETENIETKLIEITQQIPEERRREFLNHLNSLFLNVLLNRLDELGEDAQTKSNEARRVLAQLIQERS